MNDEKECDVVIDGCGAMLSVLMLDRLIAKVWEQKGGMVLVPGQPHPSSDTFIVSGPLQLTIHNGQLLDLNATEIEWVKRHLLHDLDKWAVDADFPKDQVRVEYKGKCGLIKNLSVYGW